MIVWYKYYLPINTIVNRIVDEGVIYNQPALIIRQATKEEFIQNYIERHGKPENESILGGLYYYEIRTD